jgi:hypothetical protein
MIDHDEELSDCFGTALGRSNQFEQARAQRVQPLVHPARITDIIAYLNRASEGFSKVSGKSR